MPPRTMVLGETLRRVIVTVRSQRPWTRTGRSRRMGLPSMATSRTATGQVALRSASRRAKVMSAAGAAGRCAHAGTTRSTAAEAGSQRRAKRRSMDLLPDRIVRHPLVCEDGRRNIPVSSIDGSRQSSPSRGERVLPGRYQQPISPPHHSPVIFVSGSTEWADLIVAAIGVNAWPGEAMRATASEKSFPKVHCLTPSLRLLHASNQRLKNGRGRRFSRV